MANIVLACLSAAACAYVTARSIIRRDESVPFMCACAVFNCLIALAVIVRHAK